MADPTDTGARVLAVLADGRWRAIALIADPDDVSALATAAPAELAGETDAAVIRSRLLDELRNVRAAFSDASQTLANKLGDA